MSANTLVLYILLALQFYFQLALKRTYNDEHTRHGWKTTVPWTVEYHFDPSSFENVSHRREEHTRGSWNFRSFVQKSLFVHASKRKLSRSKQFPLDKK